MEDRKQKRSFRISLAVVEIALILLGAQSHLFGVPAGLHRGAAWRKIRRLLRQVNRCIPWLPKAGKDAKWH